MIDELQAFKQFMKRRESAAGAYVNGDAAPLGQLVAREGDATFFSPLGDYVEGADAVSATYERDAAAFAPGSDSNFEILQMAASDGLAYWVGFQRAMVHMQGRSEPVPFHLRVTEIYRRDGDEWKLVHRHADPLATASRAN